MDYPALYFSSDELSQYSQRAFFRAIFLNLLFLVVASIISVLNVPSAELAIIQTMVLLGALSCSVYLFLARPDLCWYSGRAVAESIKTISWRFIIRAEPFNTNHDDDLNKFRQTLKSIVEQNRDIAKCLISHLEGAQITDSMIAMRKKSIHERLAYYVESRINEQQKWYAKKSAYNKYMAKRFFIILISTNVIAVCLAISRVRFPSVSYWPTDVLIALSAGLLTWIQAKRYSELSGSYALATHEISLIKEQSIRVRTEEELSSFVGDAENAFSREHTQWVARRDT